MKKILMFISTVPLFLAALNSAQAQNDLVYVAVDPCRVADTRSSSEGVVKANTNRDFRIVGSSGQLGVQGGVVNCLNPKAASGQVPVAVAAYIIAVPAESSTSGGVLSVYPSNLPPPPVGSGSTVNFGQGQVIGNTTIVSVCNAGSCPAGGELAVLARNTDEHVVIDVQGYFYRNNSQGVAFGTGLDSQVLPSLATTVVSVSMNIPESGFVLLNFSAWVSTDAGVSTRCSVTQNSSVGPALLDNVAALQTVSSATQAGLSFSVPASVDPGINQFSVQCRRDNAGANPTLFFPRLTAVYSTNNLGN